MGWKQRNQWVREKRESLYRQQGGLCHWCKQKCHLPGEAGYIRPKTGALGGKAATLDHLYSRLNPLRWYGKTTGPRYVMACCTCNQKRSKEECSAGLQADPPKPPPHARQRKASV